MCDAVHSLWSYMSMKICYSLLKKFGSFVGGDKAQVTVLVAMSVAVNQGPGFFECTVRPEVC